MLFIESSFPSDFMQSVKLLAAPVPYYLNSAPARRSDQTRLCFAVGLVLVTGVYTGAMRRDAFSSKSRSSRHCISGLTQFRLQPG